MGGSGGGGSSGKVGYPAYLETLHSDALNHGGADTITHSLYDLLEIADGNNPYLGAVAYDPSSEMVALADALDTYADKVDEFEPSTLWSAGIVFGKADLETYLYSDSDFNDDADAFRDKLEAQLTSDVLPRFQAGMRDINSVMSSSFVIGQSILEDGIDREVAEHLSKLRVAGYMDKIDKVTQWADRFLGASIQKIEFYRTVSALTAEINRIRLLFKMEYDKQQLAWDNESATWQINLFQNLANLIASPSGGTAIYDNKDRKNSPWAGALSGAASGAQIGSSMGGYGAGIGALVGGVAGYLSS